MRCFLPSVGYQVIRGTGADDTTNAFRPSSPLQIDSANLIFHCTAPPMRRRAHYYRQRSRQTGDHAHFAAQPLLSLPRFEALAEGLVRQDS